MTEYDSILSRCHVCDDFAQIVVFHWELSVLKSHCSRSNSVVLSLFLCGEDWLASDALKVIITKCLIFMHLKLATEGV